MIPYSLSITTRRPLYTSGSDAPFFLAYNRNALTGTPRFFFTNRLN